MMLGAPTQDRIRESQLILAAWLLLAPTFTACADEPRSHAPSALYIEAGVGKDVESTSISVTWDLTRQHESALGPWNVYLDLSAGRWQVSDDESHEHQNVYRTGLTPVLRAQPNGWGRLFIEAGIGVNWIFPNYRNGDKEFSTSFNFGDHLAFGWRFGRTVEDQELVLRVQHFSNGSIEQPNPGENFLQLRYGRRF